MEALTQFMSHHDIFQDLSNDETVALVTQAVCKRYGKGETIVGSDRMEGTVYLLIDGRAYLYGLLESGKEVILQRFDRHDIFGLPFLDPGILPADLPEMYVKAGACGAHVARFSSSEFRRAIASTPDGAEHMIVLLGRHISRHAQRELLLMRENVRVRLAALLLHLTSVDERGQVHETHEELAQMIGTARQQVTEILCELRRTGMITYQRCGPIQVVADGATLMEMMSEN